MCLKTHFILYASIPLFGLASQAQAQSRYDWGGTSAWIEIHEPDHEHRGARAQVTFHNEMVHGPDDNECFPLTLNEFTATVCFEWNVRGQAERATVLPPDGYVAQPPEITVDEGQTDTLWIFGATS